MPTILAVIADGFEEIEAVTPIDLLRRAGAEVTLASLGNKLSVTGRSGLVIQAERTLAEIANATSFDCLFLPGGPHVMTLRQDPRIKSLIQDYAKAGKWVVAICAAPVLLKDAGVLAGKRFTAHHSVVKELPDLLAGLKVVADGKVITSRGAGTSVDFGLALVEHLVSPAKAREIASSISA